MKKYLGIILDSCALLIAACAFIAMIGSAVNFTVSIFGMGAETSISCYELVTNNGGIYIAALTLLCVGCALIIAFLVLDILKVKIKYKRLLTILPILVLIVAAVLYFLAIQCFNIMFDAGELKDLMNEYGLSDLMNIKSTLGIGAICSAILCLLSSCTLCAKTLLIKK